MTAGTNNIGSVTVAGTTAVSAVALPLPTGAATAADQKPGMFWNIATGAGSALAANATLTGTARDVGVAQATAHPVAYYKASFLADQSGTASIEASNDNSTWYAIASSALAANTSLLLSVPIVTRYYRAKLVNGPIAQALLWVNSSFTGG